MPGQHALLQAPPLLRSLQRQRQINRLRQTVDTCELADADGGEDEQLKLQPRTSIGEAGCAQYIHVEVDSAACTNQLLLLKSPAHGRFLSGAGNLRLLPLF